MNFRALELIEDGLKFSHKNHKYMNGCVRISNIRLLWNQKYKIRYQVVGLKRWFATKESMW